MVKIYDRVQNNFVNLKLGPREKHMRRRKHANFKIMTSMIIIKVVTIY